MNRIYLNNCIKTATRTLVVAGLACLFNNQPAPARADTTPEIDYAPSSIQNGQSVMINGSGFGSKYPVEPLQWDNFDDEEIGANLVGSEPVIGSPWSSHGLSPVMDDARTHSGERSAFVNLDQGVTRFRYIFNPHTDKVFVSWWRYHESDPEVVINDVHCNPPFFYGQPGYDSDDCHNYKMLYLMGDQGSNELEPQIMIGAIMTSRLNWQHAIQGGVFTEYNNVWDHPYSYSATINQWQRWDTYSQMESGDFTLNDGILNAWISGRKVLDRHTYDYGTVSSKWQDVGIGALFRPESAYTMFQSYFDDIYIDNTQARIEICDSLTWTDRELNESHCEIQIPHTTWVDNQIKFTVNQGTFTDGESAYLYVVDENGVVNTASYPITFAGATDCTPAWDCSDWSVCADSIQTRSCHDNNNCGSDAGRPVETAGCDSTAPGMVTDLVAS